MKAGILVNPSKGHARGVVGYILRNLNRLGANAVLVDDTTTAEELSTLDLVLVLGGDGTILHAAHRMSPLGIPILGVNFGRVGFLTELEMEELEHCLERLVNRDFWIEERMMLKARVLREGRLIHCDYALNDIVLRSAVESMSTVGIFVDEMCYSYVRGDGVLVCTPSGSTAYSLSAGGPVLEPQADALVITPLCPFFQHCRPLVVSSGRQIKLVPVTFEKINMTVDGESSVSINRGETILVGKAEFTTRVVRFKPGRFFEVLSAKAGKMSWEVGY